jgi:hypothetical protein
MDHSINEEMTEHHSSVTSSYYTPHPAVIGGADIVIG